MFGMALEKRYVRLTNHAMLDCIPLRFGFIPDVPAGVLRAEFDEVGTSHQKPIEIRRGNKHFKGHLELTNKTVLLDATFVLSSTDDVVTIFRADDRAARSVSDIVRAKREAGEIDSEWIIENLYPLYQSGRIKNEMDLFNILIEITARDMTVDLQREIKRLQALVEQMKTSADEASGESIILGDRDTIIKKDKQDPDYDGEDIDISPAFILKDVTLGKRQNAKGREVACTFLHFEESIPVRKMDEWADPNGERTELAKSLIGKSVRTTTWRPDKYSPMEWFRNIYEA